MKELFTEYGLPATLAIIMGGMGLSLDFRDFKQVFVRPRPILTGLFSQLIVLPLIAFLLVAFIDIDPYIKVGFILIAACPGGTASNLVTYLLRGNVALCVSLSSLNSLLILFSLPLYVNLALQLFVGTSASIHLPFSSTMREVFFVIAIPVFTGMLIRYWKKEFADKMEKPMQYIMTGLLLAVFTVVLLLEEKDEALKMIDYVNIFPLALILNVVSMVAGFTLGMWLNTGPKNSYTISIEVGLQNSALAIFVAKSLLGNNTMAVVAVMYSSFTFFSTALIGWIFKRYVINYYVIRKLR
ncbi:MAG: bile acid:sodium symporter family protein [Salinivirgaceae bacterium]|nr:bile acid:sodium symporter family protein [Salinivirgaceae bacterium]